MKSYILGYYAPSDHLLETLANEKRRRILNALLNSHPAPMNIKDIASKGKVSAKTVYGGTYLGRMAEDGLVREVDEGEETGGSSRYVFENVNSLSRKRHTKYSFAPGNVEYTEEFKNTLNKLTNQTEIETKFRVLLEFVKYIVESVKESGEEQIVPKEESSQVCSTCGLNHECRDFIRATLLYLVDRFEQSPDYLEFLKEKNYINIEHYNEYCKLIQTNLGQRISRGIITEPQFTPSEMNAEQTAVEKPVDKELISEGRTTVSKKSEKQILAEHWFENRGSLTKRMIEYIIGKRKISIELLKSLVDTRKSKDRSRSDLDALHGIAESLGVSLSDDLILGYHKRKKQQDYEDRTREKISERRKKLRARELQTHN